MAEMAGTRVTLARRATMEKRLVWSCVTAGAAAAVAAVAVEGAAWRADPLNGALNVALSVALAGAGALLAFPFARPSRLLPWTLGASAVLWPASWAGYWGSEAAGRTGQYASVLFCFSVSSAALLYLDDGAWRWPVRAYLAAAALVLPVGEVLLDVTGLGYDDAGPVLAVADGLLAALFVAVAGDQVRRLPRRERPPALVIVGPVVIAAALIAADGPAAIPGPSAFLAAGTLVLLAFPIALIGYTWRSRAAGARLADEIGRIPMVTGDRVRDGLRRAVGDRGLKVFYRMPGDTVYVDESGAERTAASVPARRHRVWVDDPAEPAGSAPVALVEVDARFRRKPLAERLQAVALLSDRDIALARLDTVTKVWARRAQAGDLRHRRELEEVLHEQVQQRVSAISMTLGQVGLRTEGDEVATASVRFAQSELSAALALLRTVAEQLHSPILRESGLVTALREVGHSLRLPLRVTVADEAGLSPGMRAMALAAAQDILGDVADGRAPGTSIEDLGVQVSASRDVVHLRVATGQDGLLGLDTPRVRRLSDRTRHAGGEVRLDAGTESSTVISVRMPCA
ncbi:hypothetical protein Ade02nite_79050 [Paractinoplanes deccanensis]|uniref:Signal transduction histidine kinase subgroup 3 dimerisation and phosphoacceptor domain-containing protein n=1 Tax=Paractinoplanes deccanensis TaxID=113561 RepID=A0ABQ3YH18_9ACTN|nr:hypothetical protein [Actinoplanes deccanensis]GID79264.1 hypothetical protein Ade02nite_79050 [Actinoplanes deccanensis]